MARAVWPPPIEAVATHNAAANWNRALLENAARPRALVYDAGPNGVLSPDQFDRLKGKLAQAGRAMPMPGGRCCWRAG